MSEETTNVTSKDRTCDDKHEDWKGRHGRRHHVQSAGLGSIWAIGWLFTIGYVNIPFFWKGVLALVIWPYYLGHFLAQHP